MFYMSSVKFWSLTITLTTYILQVPQVFLSLPSSRLRYLMILPKLRSQLTDSAANPGQVSARIETSFVGAVTTTLQHCCLARNGLTCCYGAFMVSLAL